MNKFTSFGKSVWVILMLSMSIFANAQTPDANGIIYVKPTTTGTGDGSSWANATSDLKGAIAAAGVSKVYAASGYYHAQSTGGSFSMKNGVEIYGGFNPVNDETDWSTRFLPNKQTGDIDIYDVYAMPGSILSAVPQWGQTSSSVIINSDLNNSAVLDGFTVIGGGDYVANGGGIRNTSSSPTLRNLLITSNSGIRGGGIYNSNSSPVVTDVVINNNHVIHNPSNIGGEGGGVYNTGASSPVFTNVLIVANSTGTDNKGGGVHHAGTGTAAFINCTFHNNYSGQNNPPSVMLQNAVTVTSGAVSFINSIVYGSVIGTYTAQNSMVEGNDDFFNENIDATLYSENDVFISPTSGITPHIGNYGLKTTAPAIDAGSNDLFPGLNANSTDIKGNARVSQYSNSGIIDMGAYEDNFIPLVPTAGIVYVKPVASGEMDGSSWDNATSDLYNAVLTTGVSKVFVAVGNYNLSDNSIILKNGVEVYGGFDPDNGIQTLDDERILPSFGGIGGGSDGSVLNGQNIRPIIWNNNNGLDNTAILDGFTLTNGKYSTGGGIYNKGASPTLRNLWIKGNTATSDGGAMFNLDSSSPVITNVTIENNTANYAGGIFNRNNSSPVMTSVVIRNNMANNDGGAMYNDVSASPVMTNVSITGNSSQNGAGIYNRTNSSPVITNALIANNTAVTNGGAIRNESNSSPQLINVTIANNSGSNAIYATDGSASFANSIVFGGIEGSFTSQYSLVEGIANILNGNIDGTAYVPSDVFTDNANGNYTLKDGAVVVNAGNNTFNTTTIDLAGNARIYNNTIDFGAYESAYATITPDANNILYVNINGSGGNGSGDSWANAIPELADALKYARLQYNADNTVYDAQPLKIYVAKGTYKPLYSARNGYFTETGSATPPYTDQDNAFVMVKNVQIYGGFDPDNDIDDLTDTRIFGANGSVLSGEIGNTWDINYPYTNTNHVVIASGDVGNALLNGFTITRAFSKSTNAMLTVFIYPVLDAFGAMYCVRSSPTVENCIFTDNGTSGGNMFNYQQSSPTIINCTFINNGTAGNGGAIYNSTNSSPTITNCSFTENSAASNGGAIYNSSNSNPIITNCSFKNNSAYYNGGAIWNSASSPIITNSLFANNKARGGNISNPIGNGGAIYNETTSSPVLTNVSIANNTGANAFYSTGTGSTTFYNSIVFGTVSATYTAQYSLIEGNADLTNGNLDATGITATAVFTDYANDDYTLKENSPAIDRGSNALFAGLDENTKDLAGNERVYNNGIIDLGAYELQSNPSNCNTSTVWNGTIWSNGEPDSDKKAVIDGALVLSADFEACELEVTANGSLNIPSGKTFTVNGKITNNATAENFIVTSGGNLMQLDDVQNAGNITVQRNSFPLYRQDYTLWSSPVTAQNLRNFSPQTLFNRFYSYDTDAGTIGEYTQEIFTTADMQNKIFEPAKGYLIRMPNNWPVFESESVPGTSYPGEFIGIPNNGAISITLSTANTAANLVGNPYPSSISISEFFDGNPDIEQTLYFWRKRNGVAGSGYASYTSLGLTSPQPEIDGLDLQNIITAGQGFFIRSVGVTTLHFNNLMRSSSQNGVLLRSGSQNEKHRIWLNLSNQTDVISQTLLGYASGATEGVDNGLDGAYFNDSAIALTSLIDNQEYAIQARSLPFDVSDVVPLGFKTDSAGSYTISLSNFDGLFTDQDIFLKDNFNGQLHDLKISAYGFVSENGTFNDRFSVVYQSPLDTKNPEIDYNRVVIYKQQSEELYINSGNMLMQKVELFDIRGRLIYSQNGINDTVLKINPLNIASQVLIVRINSVENYIVTKKIIY